MVRLTFYYKPGCWLCDMAEEMLNGLMGKYEIEVNKIDITSNDALYELYRFDIPVFEFKDGSTLHGRIKKKDLLKKLEENSDN
ncbi:glutaredoxin family protein [Dissulfurispira sp.]|uniref:glutaredoxin family protein n=1 Tax=Dissulfurispira sp. TaxID=2817609 RepID=UPI002FDA6F0B